jgi:molybdopterin-guanine dinucleotide biosynthesis protein A
MAAPAVMGAVMAGGNGSRMGRPKADLQLNGRALIEYPLAAFADAGIEAVVVAKRATPLPELDVPVWLERDEPSHPAVGIVTALQRTPSDTMIVVGCDMPFVTPEVLSYMATLPDAIAVPFVGDSFQPLLGRYPRVVAPSFAFGLGKDLPLQQVVSELGPHQLGEEELRPYGDPERMLFNVNTPDDLAKAEALLQEEAA